VRGSKSIILNFGCVAQGIFPIYSVECQSIGDVIDNTGHPLHTPRASAIRLQFITPAISKNACPYHLRAPGSFLIPALFLAFLARYHYYIQAGENIGSSSTSDIVGEPSVRHKKP
jgi:hypothetical protein